MSDEKKYKESSLKLENELLILQKQHEQFTKVKIIERMISFDLNQIRIAIKNMQTMRYSRADRELFSQDMMYFTESSKVLISIKNPITDLSNTNNPSHWNYFKLIKSFTSLFEKLSKYFSHNGMPVIYEDKYKQDHNNKQSKIDHFETLCLILSPNIHKSLKSSSIIYKVNRLNLYSVLRHALSHDQIILTNKDVRLNKMAIALYEFQTLRQFQASKPEDNENARVLLYNYKSDEEDLNLMCEMRFHDFVTLLTVTMFEIEKFLDEIMIN